MNDFSAAALFRDPAKFESEREAQARLHEAAPLMVAVLEELEDIFDQQTYSEKARMEFDAPDDHEFSVNITAKQLRAIGAALAKAQS